MSPARPVTARLPAAVIAVIAVLAAVLAAGSLTAGPARAQAPARARAQSGAPDSTPTTAPATPPGPVASGPRLELVAQDAWTPLGADVGLRLAVTNPPPGATLSFSVHQAFTARRSYDATMLGGPLASVLSQTGVDLGALPVDDAGDHVVALGLQSPTEPLDRARLNVRRAGIYPLVVDLRDADERTVASFRTALLVVDPDRPPVTEPLEVAWVWPITEPPSFLPNGQPDRDVIAALRPEGRLGRMVGALNAYADVPVTLAPTGETIEAWVETADADLSVRAAADGLRAAAVNRQVLDGPYVPMNLPALLDHGLYGAVDDGFTRGTEALRAFFGPSLDSSTRVVEPASPSAVGRVNGAGAKRQIVDAAALAPGPETRLTPAQPVTISAPLITGGTEPVTALVTDPAIQQLLTAADLAPALRAQLVLGALAVVAQEAPSVPRVVTMVNPDDYDPPTELLTALLAGLRNNPYLRPVTTAQAFDTVALDPPTPTVNAGAATSERVLALSPSTPPAVSADEYGRQRTRLNSFGALTRAGDPDVGVADRSLLASVTSAWPLDIGRARARAHLGVVDRVVDDFVGRIEVPDPRTITLTSRSGEIPLTFRNDTGAPIRLRAALSSAKLFFPHGTVLDLDLPRNSTTIRVAVEARTSGTFPLDLEVTSTDGVLPISQRRLEVRSTYVSTVGIVLMVSAVGFLAVWWGIDLRRRRRRRARPAPS